MASRWSYSVSYTGKKKQISGMTFYRVKMGKDIVWASMSGIRMLNEAWEKGVRRETARKALSKYTGHATQVRVNTMKANIRQNWSEYIQDLELGELDGNKLSKGIKSMAQKGNLKGSIFRDMERLLNMMTEEELQTLVKENKSLLQDFFEDSDPLTGATSTPRQIKTAEANVEANAKRLRDRMLEIVARR